MNSRPVGVLATSRWNLSESLGAKGVMSSWYIWWEEMKSAKAYLAESVISFYIATMVESTNLGGLSVKNFIRVDYFRFWFLYISL